MPTPIVIKENDINALPDIIDTYHPEAMKLEVVDCEGNIIINVMSYNRKTGYAVVIGGGPFISHEEYKKWIEEQNPDDQFQRTNIILKNSTIRYKKL